MKTEGLADKAASPQEPTAADRALADSEARFRSLIEMMPAAMYTCDAEGRITLFNPQAVTIWGRAPNPGDTDERFCGAFRLWRLDGTRLPHAEGPVATTLRTGESFRGAEVVIERPDGSRVTVAANIDPIRDAAGRINGAVSVFVDISEQKRGVERLRESEERLRLALEGADFGAWDADPRTGNAVWNRRHTELQGYAFEDGPATIEKWRARVHPDDYERVVAEVAHAEAKGEPVAVEYRLRHTGGGDPVWIMLYGRFYYNEAGVAVRLSGVSRDISARKRVEERLLQRNRQLDLLSRTSQRLLLCDRPEHEMLEAIFADTAQLVGSDAHFHYRPFTPGLLALEISAGFTDQEREPVSVVKMGEHLCGRVAAAKAMLLIEDLQTSTQAGAEVLKAWGAASYAGFPLVADGKLIGTIAFVSRQRTHFRDGEVQVIKAICDQVAITLEGRRLQREVQETEALNAFLVKLSDALAPLTGAAEIQAAAERILGEELGASRAAYDEIDADGHVTGTENTRAMPPIAGRHPVASFVRDLFARDRRGDAIVVRDVGMAHSQAEAESLRAIQVGAYLGVPLLKGGRFTAVFTVHSPTPRNWTSAEVRMAAEATDRTWAAVERARAEDRLRVAHNTFRHLVERSPFGIYAVDADFRLVQVSEGAQKVFANVRPLIGRDFAEVMHFLWPEPFASEAIQRFRHTLATGETYRSQSMVERRADIRATEAYDWKIERITLPDGRYGVVCHFYDLSERQAHEQKVQLLMQEVNHRAKNMLALVEAVARQTASIGLDDFLDRFSERVRALAASQELLVQTEWQGADLGQLIESQLLHFKELVGERIVLNGPPVEVSPKAAQTLGMAIHELSTNAAKYGGLSNAKGRIAISWRVSDEGDGPQFSIHWQETDGPPVIPPARSGFGQRVAQTITEASLSAKVSLTYAETGVVWTLSCPLGAIGAMWAGAGDGRPAVQGSSGPQPARGILIVEDDAILAMNLAEALHEAGYDVVGPAVSVPQALDLLEQHHPRFAILDVNLGNETSEPVARRLRERAVPIISISGNSRSRQPAIFQQGPFLPKPVHVPSLLKEIERHLN